MPTVQIRTNAAVPAIGYICDKFGDFHRPFRGTSKCFYCKIFRIELRCEWVNTKNLFFHGMLVHSSVAMETCFGQLALYENCNGYTFKCNSI